MPSHTTTASPVSPNSVAGSTPHPLYRIEVRTLPGREDARATSLLRQAHTRNITIESAHTSKVYLVQADMTEAQLGLVISELLVDPVFETATLGTIAPASNTACIEVHPLAGVMDPAAQSVQEAIHTLTGVRAQVSTGMRYDMHGTDGQTAKAFVEKALANTVIHAIHTSPFHPVMLPRGHEQAFHLRHITLRTLSDAELAKLSRDSHLFLSLAEMQRIRLYYQDAGREPTDIELETLAQTWSEHCVHKTLKSIVSYRETRNGAPTDTSRLTSRPGHTINPDGSCTIENLLRSTIAAATFELMDEGVDWTLSVFKDNAGIVAFDEEHAVCIKVETHNHPSAIEPYGGAATGIGGCIRDVIGTGLSAKPIASTDVFCVASPDFSSVPTGCIAPKRTLEQVVSGVRDYGNRMGIPTVNGAVYFDERFVANPLVFCGSIGIMPRHLTEGKANPGDLIVALGGRTGRDGIHGATFSSAELTDTHATEFGHAVQIGNAIEEKRVLDATLRARDEHGSPLFSAITDCGAGGFSSAVGEMGEKLGANVQLESAPLKYAGLSYTEIWISEAQERMVMAVPKDKLRILQAICDEEHVELAVLGTFGNEHNELVLNYKGTEVGRLPMSLLHDGIPMPTRDATWNGKAPAKHTPSHTAPQLGDALRALLEHPNIASKHWIIRQYDHEVQGNVTTRPLVGPSLRGPGDASIVNPVPDRDASADRGIAISCGLQIGVGDPARGGDPYLMALAGIDEAVRNLVCVGADPSRIAILDNFCWPSCNDAESMGWLVRACEGCYDAAKAYRTPFVSGKDSLNNQFTTDDGRTIRIPPTLLITGLGIVPSIARSITMDAKRAGNLLVLVGSPTNALGGSHAQLLFEGACSDVALPTVDLHELPTRAKAVASMIQLGLVRSCHDVSDGGLLCAIAEMLIAGSTPQTPIGIKLEKLCAQIDPFASAFAETPGLYVMEIESNLLDQCRTHAGKDMCVLGTLDNSGLLVWEQHSVSENVEKLASIWRSPLNWSHADPQLS